ncbi:glycosyltransferase family 2 protein [Pararhizobium sp.]|uniref:glycosyltransferase family 2 protein n=1 Tax=Pararhizobium sp. TaxID=1977563 RepID=UPI0027165FE8|nr:glycosyltransferase [Pararhizobium sp.]MDO9416276.1 glycosyltransferase [Pararhizobium sp.]
MLAQPKLTICVPSRNRQRYFQETIRSLLINLRTDVEFVFADNSDDATIMEAFMKDVAGDPRVKFIPPAGRVLSMVDNWERCLEASTGEFACVIGDDDYIDANVVDLIVRTQAEQYEVDVFVWSRMTYNWPSNQQKPSNICIPLGTDVARIPRAWLYEEFFGWKHHKATPNSPFSIYHGAVSMKVMREIKRKFGGRFFEHPVVDFENICKALTTATNFFYSERPFSVMGACPESNSATINNAEKMRRGHAQFMAEVGRNIDDDPYMRDFPFPTILGIAACVAQCQHWFRSTYGYGEVAGWERYFAEACGINCGMSTDRETYDLAVEGYTAALSVWKNGKYLDYFKPAYNEPVNAGLFYGISEKHLFIDEKIAGVQTPAELYHLAEQMIAPGSQLALKLEEHFKAA